MALLHCLLGRAEEERRSPQTPFSYSPYQSTARSPAGAGSWTNLCGSHQLSELRREQSTWNINMISSPRCLVKIHVLTHFICLLSIIGHPVAVFGYINEQAIRGSGEERQETDVGRLKLKTPKQREAECRRSDLIFPLLHFYTSLIF